MKVEAKNKMPCGHAYHTRHKKLYGVNEDMIPQVPLLCNNVIETSPKPTTTRPVMDVPRPDIACKRCGHIAQHVALPGRGVHYAELICAHGCGHIKWLSNKAPEERARSAVQHRNAYMERQLPSQKQLDLLRDLEYHGAPPRTRFEASRMIDQLIASKGARR